MTEIHAFDPDGTPSPGAQAALDSAVAAIPESILDPQIASYVGDVSTATGLEIAESTAPQVDYVGLLSALASYDRMTVTKVDQWNSLNVRCSSPAGGYVQYTITNDLNYQYVAEVATLDPASTGPAEGDVVTASFTSPELTLTNFTWKGATTTPFVEQVGAVWTCSVTTTTSNARVVFQSQADDRGGLWRLSVDDTALQADVSTWAAVFGAISVEAFTIPTPGTWTIRGEFVGDDPLSAPSSGTSRGWTKGINATDGNQTVQIIENGSAVPVEQQISPRSNKDFAIRLKPYDAAASEFVPRHGTDSEAFASPTKYLNAGALLDVAAMSVGQTVEVESFEWVQHIYGRNSNTGTRNIAEVWTTQRITPDGIFHVAGRWKTLEDLEAGARVYHLMMMGSTPLFDEAVSSLAGSYRLDGPTGNVPTTEGNLADSWALLSSTSNAVAAVRYNNRRESLRTGQMNAPPRSDQTFIELRANGTQAKVYPATYEVGATIPAGRLHRFNGAYFYGSVPGAHSTLSLQ